MSLDFFDNQQKHRFNIKRKYRSQLILLALIVMGFGWYCYRSLQRYWQEPDAILVLGGHENREHHAAKLAAQYPQLPIWVSSGSPQAYAKRIFTQAGIASHRIKLDYRARDTVTNFTSLVGDFQSQEVDCVFLITSANHMRRASIIGEIVFGSRGITIIPISVPAKAKTESLQKTLRDSARAMLWLATGVTGDNLTCINPGQEAKNRQPIASWISSLLFCLRH